MMEWIKIPAGGTVDHDFEIAKYPVTNEEYALYLQSLSPQEASQSYCRLMDEHFFGGILRREVKDQGEGERRNGQVFRFEVKEGFEKKPVVFVSWYDACAFAEWAGGRLPMAEEWLKAAAWLPEKNRLAAYCTGCDEPPRQSEVNYYDHFNGWALPAPHLADVDWYRPSGPFGLCGMAGNVGEWVDAELPNGWKRALGGSLFRPVEFTRTDAGEADHPSKRLSTFGFRIVRGIK